MMVLFYVGSGLAAIATGLATGPLGIGIGLTLIGLFGSIYHPVGIAMLVANRENVGRACRMAHCCPTMPGSGPRSADPRSLPPILSFKDRRPTACRGWSTSTASNHRV